MELLLVNRTAVWQMTGIGLGVVFVILILLVYILKGFSAVFSSMNKTKQPAVVVKQSNVSPVAPKGEVTGTDEVAIATALYLYFQDVHDEESYCLTIKHNPYSAWHSEFTTYKN